jgi:hypothetical protein
MSTIAVGTGTLFIQDSGGIQYSTDNLSWTPITAWPVTIQNLNVGTTLVVSFVTDITLTAATQYFICGSPDIQIGDRELRPDGTIPTITVTNVSNFPGLVQNGSKIGFNPAVNGYNNISICNLFVSRSGTTTLRTLKGWVAQDYFGTGATNNNIIQCISNGPITLPSVGGIVGAYCAFSGGNVVIRGCQSTGIISGINSGGIVGELGASGSGSNLTIEECSSSGSINGGGSGGICGRNCGQSSGIVTVIRCYSTGNVTSNGCGGIFGVSAGTFSGNANAINCYSFGNILSFGGGMFGNSAGTGGGTSAATATNCYSTGNITGGGGGIFGAAYGNTVANNCYTTGSVDTGVGSGGIWAGSSNDNLQGSNNYAEGNHSSSGWNDLNALTTLTGTPGIGPAGTSWISLGPNQPYRLRTIGFSPYLFTNITNTYTLTNTYSESVAAGSASSAAILPGGYTYTIVAINNADPSTIPDISINSATGEIQTTTALAADTYTIVLQAEINPYSVTTVVLTVSGNVQPGPVPNFLVVPACCDTLPMIRPSPATNNSSEVITADKAGKVIVRNVNTYYDAIANKSVTYLAKPVFATYREYMEYLQGQ